MQSTLVKTEEPTREVAPRPSAIRRLTPLLILSAFWLFCALFIGLSGNFPINDDWIYAESVQHFLQTGQIRLLACAPACLFQITSAAAVCKVVGFSYETLRAVGFFWAALGSFALYGCLRELKLPRASALLMSLCLAANPLFMCLAFSFMTDTPAIALMLSYMYFLLHGLRRQKESAFMAATICLIAATCVRQNLGFLASVNAAILLCMWLRRRHSWTLLLGLTVAPLGVGFLADKWMVQSNDFIALYLWYKGMVGTQISHLLHTPGRMLPILVQIAGEFLCYLGLFALPIIACFIPTVVKTFRKNSAISPVFPVASAALVVYSLCRFIIGENRWMPFSQNLLRLPELGAHTILGINQAALSNKWRQNLTWVSGIAGFVLSTLLMDCLGKTAVNLFRAYKHKSEVRFGRALCAAAAGLILLFQFAFTTLQSTFSDIDRYYLFPFVGVIFCLALSWRWHRARLISIAAIPLLLVMASYSVAATQDMMAWNRARWAGITKLEAAGVGFKQIDGGSEYNYARDPQLFKNLILHETWYEFTHRGDAPRNQWRWWTVAGEDYLISFSPVPDYEIVSKEPYWSALSGEREILVLKHVK